MTSMEKNVVIALLLSALLSLYSCDKCRNALDEQESLGIWLNFEDKDTRQNLFFGPGKVYEPTDFQLFIKGDADTLIEVIQPNYQFSEGIIYKYLSEYSPNVGEDIIETLYYRLPQQQSLDTIDIAYNEIQHECIGLFKEGYDVQLNGILICDDCSHADVITIYK